MSNGNNRVNGLLEEIEREMDRTWADAHADDDYTRQQAEADLLARHPLIVNAAEATLIEIASLAADGIVGEDDEMATAAVIMLDRRLAGV